MSGHSKWNNIKNKKAIVDAKKGKVFSEIAKKIRIAVKEGKSSDPQSNSSLRLLLEKARTANMPKVKIQKAIDCGLGKGINGQIKEVIYEGFGPGGVALLIVTLTDNFNKMSSELKCILSKKSGSLGAPGCVMYMFKRGEAGNFICTMPFELKDDNQKTELNNLLLDLRNHDDVEDVYINSVIDK